MSKPFVQEEEERKIENSNNHKNFALIVASSAIFASLSFLLSFLAPVLPRVQWGMALFDPVSIIWVLAFLIFGIESGLLSSVIGTLLLIPFDPFAPIGPFMKLAATLPLIVIPWLIGKLGKRNGRRNGIFITRNIIIDWVTATIVRIIIMIFFNYLVFITMFSISYIETVTLEFIGLPNITAWNAIIISVILLNLLQSIWDYFIPILIIKGPSIENKLPNQ